MRVQTEEWRRFIPGVRMYRGKKTLFWNGEPLWDPENLEYLVYDEEEQKSWEVIIVLPGVEEIPEKTFWGCKNLKNVIMADTVGRIEDHAFFGCESLEFVKLSRNLEYIGEGAYRHCRSLSSIFIPPSCREIAGNAFQGCEKLIIFHVPQHTELGRFAIAETALIKASPFDDRYGHYTREAEVNQWAKNINQAQEYAMHRACSCFDPNPEMILEIVQRQGLSSFYKPNSIGITPLQYLRENPYNEINQRQIINRYVLDMMSELVIE